MSRFFPYILGPELMWTVVCVIVRLATKRHLPPTEAVTSFLDDYWGWLPFIFVPLTFALFFVPGPGRWWLLLRIDLAVAVGIFVAASIFANGMTYHKPSSGPGAGTAFMVIPIFGLFVAGVGTVLASGILLWRARH